MFAADVVLVREFPGNFIADLMVDPEYYPGRSKEMILPKTTEPFFLPGQEKVWAKRKGPGYRVWEARFPGYSRGDRLFFLRLLHLAGLFASDLVFFPDFPGFSPQNTCLSGIFPGFSPQT